MGACQNIGKVKRYCGQEVDDAIEAKNVFQWFFNADQESLDPQESLIFNTSYIHNEQDIADIKIEFYKEEE